MSGMTGTACKKCNRFLWEKDADKNGLCPDCRVPVAKVPAASENWLRKKKGSEKEDK